VDAPGHVAHAGGLSLAGAAVPSRGISTFASLRKVDMARLDDVASEVGYAAGRDPRISVT
jgi:hypothetical protein